MHVRQNSERHPEGEIRRGLVNGMNTIPLADIGVQYSRVCNLRHDWLFQIIPHR